GLLPELPAV
nr:Chain C, G9V [Toxoplasma gondii]